MTRYEPRYGLVRKSSTHCALPLRRGHLIHEPLVFGLGGGKPKLDKSTADKAIKGPTPDLKPLNIYHCLSSMNYHGQKDLLWLDYNTSIRVSTVEDLYLVIQ